jgi:hypothetical protein
MSKRGARAISAAPSTISPSHSKSVAALDEKMPPTLMSPLPPR